MIGILEFLCLIIFRCYNLSNSVAMVLLEALRQQGFPNMEKSHHYENDKLKDNYNPS